MTLYHTFLTMESQNMEWLNPADSLKTQFTRPHFFLQLNFTSKVFTAYTWTQKYDDFIFSWTKDENKFIQR